MNVEVYRKIKALLLIATLVGADVHQAHSSLDNHQFNSNLGALVSTSSGGGSSMVNFGQLMEKMGHSPLEALMKKLPFQEQAEGMSKHLEALQEHTETMKADPRVQHHAQRVSEQMEEIAKSSHFHEHFKRFAEQMESRTSGMEQAKLLQEHMETMMADPILKKQGQRVAEEMGAMYADPKLQEQAFKAGEGMGAIVPAQMEAARRDEAMMSKFQEQAAHLGEQMEKLMADPAVQEQARRIEEQVDTLGKDSANIDQEFLKAMADKSLQEKTKHLAEKIKGMMATSKESLEDHSQDSASQVVEAMAPGPNFQGKTKNVAEQLDAMMAGGQEEAKLAVERMEALIADPNFQGHAHRFTEQMEKMKNDPAFQAHMTRVAGLMEAAMARPEFQEQAKLLAQRMEGTKASQEAQLVTEQLDGLMADLNIDLNMGQVAEKQDLTDRLVDRMVGDFFDRSAQRDQALDGTVVAKSDADESEAKLVLNMRGGGFGKKEKAEPAPPPGSNSVMSSTANTVKAIVGAGILSLSWSFYYSSMLPAIFFSAVLAALAAMNFFLLGLVADKTKQSSYTEIWSKLFGKSSGILPDLTIILACFANCAGYLIVAGDYVPVALKGLGINAKILQSRYNAIMLVFALILPLSFLKDLSVLSYTSIIGVLGGLYTCGMLGYDGFAAGLKASDWQLLKFTPGWLLMIPAVAFAFNGHFNAPTAYMELSDRTPKRWATVTAIAFSICFVATVACGASGYLMFGQEMEKYSNVLTAPKFHTDKAAMVAYIATTVSVALGYPLNSQALRNCMESLLINYAPKAISKKVSDMSVDVRRNTIAAVMVFLTLAVALATDSLGLLNSINGAIGGCLMVFLMPSMMYLKSVEGEEGSALSRILPMASVIGGLFIGVSGTITAVLASMGVKLA